MSHAAKSLALFLLAAVPSAQDSRVDDMFSRWDKDGSPGLAVAVMQEGEILLAEGYGNAQIEYDAPITPETVFHVASVSKQFTAFAALLLEADGKLSMDDPVKKHLPEFPDFGHVITLEHLVHHTSGLRDQWESLCIAGWRMDDVITTEHVLTFVENQRELNFVPGSEHLYCNTGYTLLGEVVARVSGMSFPSFCKKRIFDPLGMEATHFHDDHQRVVRDRAYSYRGATKGYSNAVLSYANAGATSLFTSAIDLLYWLQNLSTGDVGGEAVIEKMRKRFVLNDGTEGHYGYGVVIDDRNGYTRISHGGADAGFRSHVSWYPEAELAVVVLSNLGQMDAEGAANRVANLYLPEERGPVPPREPRAQPESAPAEAQADIPEPARIDPSTCLGRYWSEELGTFYDLRMDGNAFVAAHRRHGKIRLEPIEGARFRGSAWFFGEIEMTRSGEGGAVTGFVLHGGRVRNLRFTRMP